jgi:Relaxase/Mobilisation nuclease domain
MISTITKGSDFKGLLDYLLKEEKQPEIIKSEMLGKNASGLAKEFNDVAAQKPNVELTVRHISLSFAPDDIVNDSDKALIVDRVMEQMGYEDCQYIAIAHHPDDPGHDLVHEHEHLHIVANAVSVFGERVSDSWDRLKIQPILREIEKDFGLKQVVSSVDRWAQKAVEQKTQVEKAVTKLAQIIDRAAEQQPDLGTWLDRLDQQHVDVKFTLKQDGSVRGIAYLQSGVTVRGSEIERTWKSVGAKISTSPDDVQIMAAANIKSQSHRMNMSDVERQRFEQAVMMSATALEGRERVKTGRIHLKREDKTITAYRMRPHKQILKAVETDRGWEAIGQVKIDDKDLALLAKVSGIEQVEEIRLVQIDREIAHREVVESPEFYNPSKAEIFIWYNELAHYPDITKNLRVLANELKGAYMAEEVREDPSTVLDDYRSPDVAILMQEKESMDSLVQEQMQSELDRQQSLHR